MAFVNIEDTSGSMEMLVFPQTYDQYRYLIEENQILYIEGRLTVREEEETKLVCRMVARPPGCSGTAGRFYRKQSSEKAAYGWKNADSQENRKTSGIVSASAVQRKS